MRIEEGNGLYMENRKNTLLIADDSSYNIELLTEIFNEQYRIFTAENGQQALEVMRANIGEIDAVLLDIVMPIKDGYGVLMDMNMDENLKYIPVIVITADDDIESEHKAFDYGAYDFITRPFNIKTLKQRVDGMFRHLDIEKIRGENDRLLKETQTDKHMSALLDNMPGGAAIIETDGKTAECTYFNNSAPKLFHMTDGEFVSQFETDDPKNYSEWLGVFIAKAMEEKKLDYSFSVKDNGGEICRIRLIASGIDKKGDKRVLYCFFLDVNDEERFEQRAKENDINFENVISNAPVGIAMCEKGDDGKLHIIYSSKGLADIFGYPDYDTYVNEVEKTERKMISEFEADDFRNKMNHAIVSGTPIEYTFHCRSYDQKSLWILTRAQFMKSESGRLRLYCFISDVTKEKEYEIELRNNAYYDSLTGLYNRSAFMLGAKGLLKENPDADYVIYRINIGSFKVINDIMGREIGDKVLVSVATALNRVISDKGLFSRFFADNFTVIVPVNEVTPEEIIKEIKEEVEDDCLVSQDVHYYIGVYTINERSATIEDICDRAAIACRSITGNFHTHVAYYDEKMRDDMLEEQEIRDETHRAIVNGEFCIYYQPVYGVKAKKFVSAEALVRWIHPTKGIISPGKFIPIFERNGFIAELDLYVLEQVCKYHQKRRNSGLEPFPISVNISRRSLYNPNLYDLISRLAEKYGVEPKYFRIEITETAYNDNPTQLLETVNKLREKCFPVLMDDFGSGYSSLNTLKDIPIDLLKLDMKFMQNFESNNRVGTIVTAIARMAKWLNVPLLAEGVETREQYEFLRSIGCAYIQGYYFAKPMPSAQFTDLIQLNGAEFNDKELETYGMNSEINELLGSNTTVSKLIGGVFGGLGIYELYDDKLEVIRVNDGYMQIMGYSPVDFTGEHYDIWEKVHPEDIEKSRQACLEASRTGKAVRTTVRRYDRNGKLLYLEGVHRRLGGTDENPIICIAFNDITELLEKEEIIQNANRRIDSILEATDSLAVDVDYAKNEAFCFGFTGDFEYNNRELEEKLKSGEGLDSIAHPDDRAKMCSWHSGKKSGRFSDEFRIRKKNGEYHWFRFIETRTYDENGTHLRTAGVIRDIDAEKSAYRHLESIINNLREGIALINIVDGKPTLAYANDCFYSMMSINERDKDKINAITVDIIEKTAGTRDMTVTDSSNTNHIIKVYTTEVKNDGKNDSSYIAIFTDVTQARAKEVQNQLYRMLLDQTGTVVFDYNTESDTITYYRHLSENDKKPSSVEQLHTNPEKFTLLRENDRKEFICVLNRLSESKESEKSTDELPVIIEENGYKRHYRCHFKSFSDNSEKVFRIIGKIEDVEDEMTKFGEIQAKAMYDSLCVDIYNKSTTEELIKSELKHTTGGALLMIDIDDFKSINDNLGHLFGDEFLKQFAATLKDVFRDSDIVGRYGGDEFFVFVSHAGTSVAVKKGEVILNRISEINVPKIGQVKTSIGIAAVTPENRDYRQIVKQADSALYHAKNQGKNCVILFDPHTMNETVFRSTEKDGDSTKTVPLSSNPHSEASIIMRVFSALQSGSDIKNSINRMLALVGKHFDVSRAYIFENSDDGLFCSNTYEWCGEGVKSEKDSLQNISYETDMGGMYHQCLNEDGILYCHNINTLTPAIRELLSRQGIKSVLHCAITEDGKFKGFVGFDECRENCFWTKEQVDALTYVAKVLAVFLLNDRNKNRLKNYSRSIESILYNYPEFIYIVDPETRELLYINKRAEKIIGGNKLLGKSCLETVCGGKESEYCPLKRVGQPVEGISPLLNKKVRAQATEVEWCGKKAYMISCMEAK